MENKAWWKQRKWQILIFLYILLIIRLIVFKHPYERLVEIIAGWQKNVILEGLDTANFVPFKTIKMYIRYYERLNSFENLFGNILIFIPFGFLLPKASAACRHFVSSFCVTLLFVAAIEVFQLFSAFGAFDVDDFILNCLGSCIGFVIFKLFSKVRLLI